MDKWMIPFLYAFWSLFVRILIPFLYAFWSTKRSGRERLREANERRSTEEALKRAQLAELRQNNANLEGEIEKWETYRNEGSIQHSYIINGLEHKISEQHKNTEAMKKFIQKQIETAKAGMNFKEILFQINLVAKDRKRLVE